MEGLVIVNTVWCGGVPSLCALPLEPDRRASGGEGLNSKRASLCDMVCHRSA